MTHKKPSEVEEKLLVRFGADELKQIGQDIAQVIAKHHLTHEPEICKDLFCYMSSVTFGWNSVYSGQENLSLQDISL